VIIIDSNVWIFAEVETSVEHERAAERLTSALATEPVAVTPIIASEVFHHLSRVFGRAVAAPRVLAIVRSPHVSWLGISSETFLKAVALAEVAELRINDALIAQQALESQAAVLTDDVGGFQRVRGLKVVPLR
jgi:predicted nucleic acid-binding protein